MRNINMDLYTNRSVASAISALLMTPGCPTFVTRLLDTASNCYCEFTSTYIVLGENVISLD